jgi:hypothetical protein
MRRAWTSNRKCRNIISRSPKFQTFFASGFPYVGDQ